MSYYSFYFDNELIETTIEKVVEQNQPITYKLVLADKNVSQKLGSPILITEQEGLLAFKIHQMQTNTEYGEQFLDRFHTVLNWVQKRKLLD